MFKLTITQTINSFVFEYARMAERDFFFDLSNNKQRLKIT